MSEKVKLYKLMANLGCREEKGGLQSFYCILNYCFSENMEILIGRLLVNLSTKKSQSLGSPLSARILDVHCSLILDAVSYFFFAWARPSFLTA